MNNKLALSVVIVLILGGFLFFMNRGEAPTEIEEVRETNTTTVSVKEFTIDAAPYSFTPNTISVNLGDTVKITLKNTKGTHDLKIDEFGVATRTLNVGEEQTITFVADKSGTFEYYCSIGNHRAMGMVGALTVR
ncbi:MAG: hypothetical protein A3G05_01850 [Candidatus Zambryskibacteria bacterium RIFCSPLOWO2_12_FULL_45_14]|uniref:EfeO-type cupredoxin-like domain-containing protein n=2 Tax=Candidatus Zambryskiibacteriota TaxID=1817925 RepID=A0A1G2UKV4_9BACT|nr:MAG: hypothetical protein A3H60_02875 [Candidatus Zambryskibacteria bacterium RIFCSPLOWO2_02_FULL_44_12b]OHB14094.1 MAG: hypothetical protein A3G05_01850 [Candidatus Zambryskibacteria bacterium RIFCSPLOWO2_12_FULL_45_14]